MHDNLRQYRPIPFFFLNTTEPQELSLASARKIMGRMQEAGYGGALLFNKPPTGFSQELYLSQAWYDALENFCIAAKETGLVIWINDGWDYPPGDAGGRILEEAPELIQYHLEQAADGTVQPVKTDWGFPAFEEPRSSELFHKYVYEGLKTHLGKYFGDPIVGIFSDADNRRINAHVQRNLPTYLYYPWSRSLPELFRSRFGYELTPHLAEILASADSQTAADYWQLTSELYQKWFAENHRWCSENGLLYSFHTSDTGPLPPEICRRSSSFSEGETLKLAAYCDYPGTDHELFALDGGTHYDARYFVPEVSRGGSADRWHHPDFANTLFDARAKIVSSAAWLYGRGRTLCEAFAATNWEATPEKLRRIAAWQIMQGINFFVPHAVHVKLHGTTKFFAPPEFLHAFPMAALRSFNDFLAKYSMIAAQGEYRPQLALLDPTPELWRGRGPGKFFQLFDRLNRHAVDYVITDRENADRFERVINPLDAGADVELPAPYASFTGGEVAFHRRFLPDGTSFILVANIWSSRTLSGILNYDGRSAEVELAPGEIAVFGGPYEEYRSPAAAPVRTQPLPLKWHAQWHEPQRVAFTEGFCWENREELPGLMLLVPGDGSACVSVNGTPLSNGTGTLVFDDVYTAYPLPASAGEHRADFQKAEFETPVYLAGDFSVEYTSVNDFARQDYALYCLNIHSPESERIVLSRREEALELGDWTEQGQPFYSGGVTYTGEIQTDFIPERLHLELEGTCCSVFFDGIPVGEKAFPPYDFSLPATAPGRHALRIVIHNTLANQLELFRCPGGLLRGEITSRL